MIYVICENSFHNRAKINVFNLTPSQVSTNIFTWILFGNRVSVQNIVTGLITLGSSKVSVETNPQSEAKKNNKKQEKSNSFKQGILNLLYNKKKNRHCNV